MIITLFIAAVVAVISLVMSVLPEWELPDLGLLSAMLSEGWFTTVLSYVGWGNQYLPLDQAFVVGGLAIAYFGIMYGIRLTLYILSKFHVLGGGSR